jgi:peroxiredoxin
MPRILVSDGVVSPCLTGILRPVVLLPRVKELGPVASREVVLHELAHLARGDYLWIVLSKLVSAALFFQPLVWVLGRRNQRAAEDVCDDYVVRYSPDRQTYAHQLVDIAERYLPSRCEAYAAVGVVSFRSALGRRVKRIMDTTRKLSTRAGNRTIFVVAVVAVLATLVSGLIAVTNTKGGEKVEETAKEEEPGSWEDSRAWYILRQTDSTGLLHGLPQRLGKVIVPSMRQEPMWEGVDDGGSIELEIRVEGDVKGEGEVFVGFFSDPRWWAAPPVQVRRFGGPGRYTVHRLMPGKYYVGAMIGLLPRPEAFGVHRRWPAPVEIRKGKTLFVDLLVSSEFKDRVCHPDQYDGFAGEFGTMDPARLITLRTVDHQGKPAPFCRVTYRDHDPSSHHSFHDIGTDEQGYSYCGKIDGPFSFSAARYDIIPGNFAQLWQFRRFEKAHNATDREVIIIHWPQYPTGTGKVIGRVHDQHGQPLKQYYLTIKHTEKGERLGSKDWFSIGYKVPVSDPDGRFEIDHLAPGEFRWMVRSFDYPAYAYSFDMGRFTIAEEDNAVSELDLEVEAKQLLYGRSVYEDGSPVYPGMHIARFGEDDYFALNMEKDGSFRVCLSKQEREYLLKNRGGMVEVEGKTGEKWHRLGEVHIDKLSKDANNPAGIVFARPKAEPSEVPAAVDAGAADQSTKTTEKLDPEKVLALAEVLPEQQYSRAWYMLRERNVGPLLLGLTQRLGKVVIPSRRDETMWTGSGDEGTAKINIVVEGDVKGEIFVGFFDDASWSSEPVQVRSFPGPGNYLVKNLPYGEFQIGVMIGNLPVAKALGVHRRWPEPVLVQRGIVSGAKVLVSPDFQKGTAWGYYTKELARDYIGDWEKMDPDNLLQGRVTGPSRRGIAFTEIRIREHKDDPKKGGIMILDRGTDERGYYFFDGMEWPYKVTARWYQLLPPVLGCRYQDLWFNQVLEGSQTVDFKFEDFPTGTSSLAGRVVDQHGNAIREFIIKIYGGTKDWYKERKPDGKYHRLVGYSVPFISNDGTFRLDRLPSGEFQLLPVPFNIQAYRGRRDYEVVLKAGETTELKLEFEAKNMFYGRVLFEDGKAPDPEQIRLLMPMGNRAKGVGSFDSEGYFTVHLSERELERLKSGSVTLRINLTKDGKRQDVGFPFKLLALERDKAGVLRIKRSEAKPPTQTGHSPMDLEEIPVSSIEPFSLLDTKGHTHKLSDYKGKVVLLNIFTTWCGPCKREWPHLLKLHSDYADKGLVILAISRKEKPDIVESWVRKNRPPFPVLVDQEQHATRQFANEKGRVPVPTNVLLDRHHRIVKQSRGFSEEKFAELKAAVDILTKQQ